MPAILSWLSILFISYISRDLDNVKILLYKLSGRSYVVKPARVNAALSSYFRKTALFYRHKLREFSILEEKRSPHEL